MKRIIVTCFTDPVCCWCWGSEPVMRALETRYPGDLELRQVMGGLVRDLKDFSDPDNGITATDPDGVNAQVAAHWLASARTHRMPVMAEGLRLFSAGRQSSYPQNIAFKAAQIASPDRAGLLLRRLREGSLARALPSGEPEVIRSLARESGVDLAAFDRALSDGSAEAAFQADLGLTRALGVSAFPTYLIKSSQARQMMMRGFMRFHDFERAISRLTDGDLKPLPSPPEEEVLRWLIDKEGGRLAEEEALQAFDFESRQAGGRWLDALERAGRIRRERAGTGRFITAA